MATNKKANGVFSIEFFYLDNEWVDTNDKALPKLISEELNEIFPNSDDSLRELIIYFTSNFYHCPKSMYGGPDNLGWPDESDDERLLDSVYVDDKVKLSKKSSEEVFKFYFDKIKEVELDYDYDGRDYDGDY